MQWAQGELRQLIDHIPEDDACGPNSGDTVYAFIRSAYSEFMVDKKPRRIEEALYDKRRFREPQESMVHYVHRRKELFLKLENHRQA